MTVKSETTGLYSGGSGGGGSGAGTSSPGIAPSNTARWYFSPSVINATTSSAVLADRVYWQPMLFTGMPIDRIGIDVTTGAAGLCRLGIYTNDNGLPGTLIIDAGTVDTTNIATVEATIATTYLPGAWVWVGALFNATPSVRTGSVGSPSYLGSAAFGTGVRGALSVFAYAAFPAAAPLTSFAVAAQCPLIGVRKTA